MARKVVIDNDILGWGNDNKNNLLKLYEEVLMVGSHPDLQEGDGDQKIAAYCLSNDCDLLTADIKAYNKRFKAGAHSVHIAAYDWWQKGNRQIFLIKAPENPSSQSC